MQKDILWVVNNLPSDEVETLSQQAHIPSLIAKVFLQRGIKDPSAIKEFLNPTLSNLHDPFLLNDMEKAVSRILVALEKKEKIIIYGDYDVDGVTSTSILTLFLKTLTSNLTFYIPDRIEDGYGLSIGALDKVLSLNPDLIITVDCGIVSFDEVAYVNSKGTDIIITDHHEPRGEKLPQGIAAINPHRHDNQYPFTDLAGVGVTFKLIQALCQALGLGTQYLSYLDLVAVGTIADIVPLKGENRILVSHGLKAIQTTKNIGLESLIHVSGLKDKEISSYSIAFQISPRINAAGRIGDAGRGVHLFTTNNLMDAQDLSKELNQENKNRQDTEMGILEKALLQIESDPSYADEPILVVYGKGWHHGVIGIVSSRITERYYKPSIVISIDENMAKASARSIPDFNLLEALNNASEHLVKYGGHKMAAGLSLNPEHIESFREKINVYARKVLSDYDLTPKAFADASLTPEEITLESVKSLELLAPFGQDHAKPLFCASGLLIKEVRTVGENKHLKTLFTKHSQQWDSIGFGLGEKESLYKKDDMVDILFYPDINRWNHTEKVQFLLKDIRKNHLDQLQKDYYDSLHQILNHNQNQSQQLDPAPDTLFQSITPLQDTSQLFHHLTQDKTLFLANTLPALQNILDLLSHSKMISKKDYACCFHMVKEEEKFPLTLLINPDYHKISLSNYDRVILGGALIPSKDFYKFLQEVPADRLFRYIVKYDHSPLHELAINRQEVAVVYRYFTLAGHKKIHIKDPQTCCQEISARFPLQLTSYKLLKILEILDQLEIITCKMNEKYNIMLDIKSNPEKKELLDSMSFKFLQNMKVVNVF
jgi:single-stranded-DNA-specific exonuclease